MSSQRARVHQDGAGACFSNRTMTASSRSLVMVAVTALLGCTSTSLPASGQGTAPPSTSTATAVAMTPAGGSAGAQAEPASAAWPMVATLTVDGSADKQVSPDEALFSLAVNTQTMTLKSALDENNNRLRRLVSALEAASIPSAKIQTQRVQANRVYEWTDRERIFRGFSVSRMVTVLLSDLERFENILGVLLETTEIELQGTQFRLSDPESVELEVRTEAVENARSRAEALAGAAGRTLGPALSIVNSSQPIQIPGQPPMMLQKAEMRAGFAADSGPITAPGEITVATSVQITYRMN